MRAPFLLNVAELAALLRRDVSTVHEMIRRGDLAAVGIEPVAGLRSRQFRRADVEAFLGASITAADLDLEQAS